MPRNREQLEEAGRKAEAWLGSLDIDAINSPDADATTLRALAVVTRRLADDATEQAAAVEQARRAGKTWTQIAVILGVSRQAATERFGEPADL